MMMKINLSILVIILIRINLGFLFPNFTGFFGIMLNMRDDDRKSFLLQTLFFCSISKCLGLFFGNEGVTYQIILPINQ